MPAVYRVFNSGVVSGKRGLSGVFPYKDPVQHKSVSKYPVNTTKLHKIKLAPPPPPGPRGRIDGLACCASAASLPNQMHLRAPSFPTSPAERALRRRFPVESPCSRKQCTTRGGGSADALSCCDVTPLSSASRP
ncbi:unnamed protein product [Plutella xylostella]|uniref:(diamondback moth) hypothetical protein n=1 Tax=Plutella xylostella TaxID=51655 RepID=A0A8S4G581_PLUXY|nr:unnamed protein product [Plutella xylostella]